MAEHRLTLPDGTTIPVPVSHPDLLADDRLRTGDPDTSGDVACPRLIPNPDPIPSQRVRVGVDGESYAVALSTDIVYDSFEDGAWPDDWTAGTYDYELVSGSDAIAGDYSLSATASSARVAKTGETTSRGFSYSVRTAIPDGTTEVYLLTNIQNLNDTNEAWYGAIIQAGTDTLYLRKQSASGGGNLDSTSVSLSGPAEYRVVIDVGYSDVRARVLDASDTELASTAWVTDETHTGGYPGVFVTNSGSGTRFDQLMRHDLGDV